MFLFDTNGYIILTCKYEDARSMAVHYNNSYLEMLMLITVTVNIVLYSRHTQ